MCCRKDKLVFIGVYGCQMNLADAERMEGALNLIGYKRTENMEIADVILLVTCCVRETAEDKVYGKIGEIKHLKTNNPLLIFGIAGCMAQKEGEKLLKKARHIDFVLGTNNIQELPNIIQNLAQRGLKRTRQLEISLDKDLVENLPITRHGTLSAWVPIMYGCNNFCTYCIVPYVRGREKSRSIEDIVTEIEDAVQNGFKEITLLGQNVNSYGKGENTTFANLLRKVDEIKGLERIRYMTSHPKDLSTELIDTVARSKHICTHFHLPIQHGSNRILKAMNRGYTVEQYKKIITDVRNKIKEPTITTDLIVGFPGEEEEDFEELLALIKEIRYDAAYTFLYSTRSGTPAATFLKQVPLQDKKRRLNRLMEIQNTISLEINQKLVGRELEVLVEGASRKNKNVWTGRTSGNKIVLFNHTGQENIGDMVKVKIKEGKTWVLRGEPVFR